MPTGTLPASGKKLWEKVYDTALKGSCKDSADPKKCAAGSAWKAIKNAGWSKGKDGKWQKSAQIEEFSIHIERAAYDKATNEMRWRASGSDTDIDIRKDNMSLELFNDFLERIDTKILVPEEYRSDYWSGGMPYLSVSHYGDYDGKAVPGVIDSIYVDGNVLKGKGIFNDTELGRACFRAVCDDLYGSNKESEDKVRISIGFLDYSHLHKATGNIFVRESLDEICSECLLDIIRGEYSGRKFLKGHLIHWAMTRVPINQRTTMEIEEAEVDKAMTTRKEDATTIIGEDLADELDELALEKEIAKSNILVTFSDHEDEEECDEDDEDCKEKMKDKHAKEEKANLLAGENVIEKYNEYPYALPYGGATSLAEIKKQQEAQKERWRVSDLWWATQAAIDNVLASDGEVKDKSKKIASVMAEFKDMLGSGESIFMAQIISSLSTTLVDEPAPTSHPLDVIFDNFKAAYDEVILSGNSPDDKLRLLQTPFNDIAGAIKSAVGNSVVASQSVQTVQVDSGQPASSDVVSALANVMKPLVDKLDMLIQQQTPVKQSALKIPDRRSIQPNLGMQRDIINQEPVKSPSQTPNLRAIINKST